MKILHTVESYYPASHGMQQVVQQLSERLVKLGHEVTVATKFDQSRTSTCINGVNIASFHISGNAVKGYTASNSEIQRYRDFLENSDFDIITNFAAQQWATDIVLPLLRRIKAVKIFVPTGFSGLCDARYSDYYISMKSWMADYDMNVFLSGQLQDFTFARKAGIRQITIIPNGAAADEFLDSCTIDIRTKLHIPKDHFLIIHVGSHTGLKGHSDLIDIFRYAKINKVTLLIIGNAMQHGNRLKLVFKFLIKPFTAMLLRFYKKHVYPECHLSCIIKSIYYNFASSLIRREKQIIVSNLSRPEVISAYHAADLFLFPSNIECSPLVLFECMASRTPFLSTDVGNSKEIIGWSNSGILLPTTMLTNVYCRAVIDQSTHILENIFQDANTRNEMANSGFIAWQSNFSWEKITARYEELYLTLHDNNNKTSSYNTFSISS